MKLHIAIVALLFAESSYIHAEESFVPTVTPTEKFTWDASENESTETFPPTTFLPTSFLPTTFLPTGDYVDPDAKCIVDPDANGILVIPMSWTKIGKKAFYRCGKIKSVEIPAKVQFLKDNAFSGTNNLEKITFEGGSQLEEISNEAFYGSKLQSIILPKSVLVIGNAAFRFTPIKTFTFEENSELASIGDYAFRSSDFERISVPEGVSRIGRGAFEFSALINITLPNSITTIEESTFYKTPMTSIFLPDSVTEIAYGAFANSKLTSINLGNIIIIETDDYEQTPFYGTPCPNKEVFEAGNTVVDCEIMTTAPSKSPMKSTTGAPSILAPTEFSTKTPTYTKTIQNSKKGKLAKVKQTKKGTKIKKSKASNNPHAF